MTRTASEILEQEFLQTRAKLLEVAAFFDRLDACPDNADDANHATQNQQERLRLLKAGVELLNDHDSSKAARLQLLFSREYDAKWREQFGLTAAQ